MPTIKRRSAGKREKVKSSESESVTRPGAGTDIPWGDIGQKHQVYLKIMREIIADPSLGRKYLKSDKDAAQAFRDKGMNVPNDIKVVFLPAGDSNKLGAGSAVIELPLSDPNKPQPSEAELTELFVGNYHIAW